MNDLKALVMTIGIVFVVVGNTCWAIVERRNTDLDLWALSSRSTINDDSANHYILVKERLLVPPHTEQEIRSLLLAQEFEEVRNPDGSILGAQQRVLSSASVDIVAKVLRDRNETANILNGWKWPGITDEQFKNWVEKVDKGKTRGARIELEKLSQSRGIYRNIRLENVEILERTPQGSRVVTAPIVNVQRKAPRVLQELLKNLYDQGDIETIKSLLNEVLRVTQEELWAYGVFDQAPSIQVNWGVEVNSDGKIITDQDGRPIVALFDLFELVDRVSDISESRLTEEFWRNDWVIFNTDHPLSILNLTDAHIAEWFHARITTEFTREKLRQYWETKTVTPVAGGAPIEKAEQNDGSKITRRNFLKGTAATLGLLLVRPGATLEVLAEEVDIQKAYQWMKKQIDPKTGLIASFENLPEGDPSRGVTWVYNQGEAIQTALAMDDLTMAEQLAEALLKLPRNNGVWYNAYVTKEDKEGQVQVAKNIPEQNTSYVGANMSVNHALLNVLERTESTDLAKEILSAALATVQWLNRFFHERGEDTGYVSAGEEATQVWTEYNQRAFAFYYQLYHQLNDSQHKHRILLLVNRDRVDVEDLKERADKIIRWIQNRMRSGDHYLVGYQSWENQKPFSEDFNDHPTENARYWERQMWGYPQYLGPIMASIAGLDPKDFSGGLDWLLAHKSDLKIKDKTYYGIPRWLGTPSIWAKGTAETVVALQLVGRDQEADELLQALAALQESGGGVLAAYGEEDRIWPIHFPYAGMEGTSPTIVAAGRFGPVFIAEETKIARPLDAVMVGAISASQREDVQDLLERIRPTVFPIERVLVVEDDTRFQNIYRFSFQRGLPNTIQFFYASSVEEALAFLKQHEIHLAVLDMQFPRREGEGSFPTSGLTLAGQIRQSLEIPIVFATSTSLSDGTLDEVSNAILVRKGEEGFSDKLVRSLGVVISESQRATENSGRLITEAL